MIKSMYYTEDLNGKIIRFGFVDSEQGSVDYEKDPYFFVWAVKDNNADKQTYSYEEIEDIFSSLYGQTDDQHVCDALREQNYKDWIRNQMRTHFESDENGGYVYNVDYYEDIPQDIVKRSILEAKNYNDFLQNLFNELYLHNADEDAFLDIEENIRKENIEERYGDLPCYISSDTDWAEHGYNGIKVDFEEGLLQDYKLNVFVTLDNGNKNDITDTFGNYGDIPKGISANNKNDPDIISYLIHSQGYSVYDVLKKKLDQNEPGNPFINALADELNHTSLEGMQLAVCTSLKWDSDIKSFFNLKDHELYFPRGTSVILYNPETGEGGRNVITLEHGMQMPLFSSVTYQFEDGDTFVRTDDGFDKVNLLKTEGSNKTLGGQIDIPDNVWDRSLVYWNDHSVEAMDKIGYACSWDENHLYFHDSETGASIKFEEATELAEWLDGVVFDDPEQNILVEKTMHPERFVEEKYGCPAIPLAQRLDQLLYDFDTYEYWDTIGSSEHDRMKGLERSEEIVKNPNEIFAVVDYLLEDHDPSFFNPYERETLYLLKETEFELWHGCPDDLSGRIYNSIYWKDPEGYSKYENDKYINICQEIDAVIEDSEAAEKFLSQFDIGKDQTLFLNEINEKEIKIGREIVDSSMDQMKGRKKKS